MFAKKPTFFILLAIFTTSQGHAQTLQDAFGLLGINTGKSRTFEINEESFDDLKVINEERSGETKIWETHLDFDTLVISSFINENYTKDPKSQEENISLGDREYYFATNGVLREYMRMNGSGRLLEHLWFENKRLLKVDYYNAYPIGAKYTTLYIYERSGALDSVISYVNDVRNEGRKFSAPDPEKKFPTQFRMDGGKILEATSMNEYRCPCNNIFSYEGDRLVSVATYGQKKSRKKIEEIFFDDHGLIAVHDRNLEFRVWSHSEYAYAYDSRGRWITREDRHDGKLSAFYRREFR